ncbi:MAG: cbb3-type cytochrome c oxidase subunit II [Actinobacteria bacterium]|nr:cbb3-type cytochrome c oxidase subunit II [Actinomycetota bacterium]
MSDNLTAAAEALGLPEALVRRSAEARAAETGDDVEEILAAWAGGEAAPSETAEAAEPATAEPAPEEDEAEETAEEVEAEPAPAPAPAAQPEVVIEVPERRPAPVGAPAAETAAAKPPVLIGVRDNPMTLLSGVLGLFIVVALVAVLGPSLPVDAPGARTSEIEYSRLAEEGREVYRTLGCPFCHTQMVRPVVADVGLGAVTLNDTNQVLGVRRFGPDLSDVGTRVGPAQIEEILAGVGGHPPHRLDSEDMAALVAYLSESQTSPEEPAQPDLEEGEEPGEEDEGGA